MKKLAIAASLVALAAPSAATAHGGKNHHPAGAGKAHAACKAERDSIGKDAFKEKYANERGKRAMKRCVKQRVRAARQGCKTERAADKAAFRAKYGRGDRKRNAFRRCVRQNAGA
jgi:hypothetical protein